MAINFPNAPQDGDVHTEQNTTWVYKSPPGVWRTVSSGVAVEIVEADTSQRWQVWGDILIQWGSAQSGGSGEYTLIYNQPFKSGTTPSVSVVPQTGTPSEGVSTGIPNSTQVDIFTTVANRTFNWVVVGEAPDALKKSKQVVGAGPAKQRIVDADASAGWQVWGDILIQWGSVTTNSNGGGAGVTFPKPFKNTVWYANATCYSSGTPGTAIIEALTKQSMNVRARDTNANVWVTQVVRWTAIGEAPDELKQPKVIGVGGDSSGITLQEFFDPTGAASWQIVGNKLECWGLASFTDGFVSVVTPKVFANANFRVTLNVGTGSFPANVWGCYPNVIAANRFEIRAHNTNSPTGSGLIAAAHWHAIGEWDGIS